MNWLLLALVLIAVVGFFILKKRSSPVSDDDESFPYVLGGSFFPLPSVLFWGFSIKRSVTISGYSVRFELRTLSMSQKALRSRCGSAHSIASVRSILTMYFAVQVI